MLWRKLKLIYQPKEKRKPWTFGGGLGREGKGLQLTARAIFLVPVRGREGVIIMRGDSWTPMEDDWEKND